MKHKRVNNMVQRNNVIVRIIISLAVLASLCFGSALLYAGQAEIDQLNNAIKAKGARWHADKTSVSELSLKEKKMRLGASEDENFLAEALASPETAPIPSVEGATGILDWTNAAGISYVSPVKNQGSCGSCWAFATTAGLESQVMIAGGGMPVDLSEQILVSCSGMGSCSGGSSASASSFIRDVGLPLEACFQYTATNNICSNACLNWQNSTYTTKGWHAASTSGITANDIRNAVYTYGPVVATMYVYNDFYAYTSGVYSYTSGSYLGAHAVLVVGYDDAAQAFIVKNSWGTGWGAAGFFKIAYSEVAGTSKFGYSTMVYDGYGDAPAPAPTPTPTPTPCTYSLSSSGATFKAAGGNGSVILNSQGSCSLTSVSVSSNADWVRITSSTAGNNSVTVGYAVSANTGLDRSTTISLQGLRHSVKQLQAAKPNSGKKR
jgi:hypothetical protein